MQGMESQEDWKPAAAASAFVGMGISFLIWWWYFDGVSGASERPVRSKRDALRFHVWSYAHFPLYLGIVILGVGLQRIVTAASRAPLTSPETVILTSAATTVMVAMTVIGWTSASNRRRHSSEVAWNLVLVAATLALGFGGGYEYPVVLIVAVAALCVAQLCLTLTAPTAEGALRTLAHEPAPK